MDELAAELARRLLRRAAVRLLERLSNPGTMEAIAEELRRDVEAMAIRADGHDSLAAWAASHDDERARQRHQRRAIAIRSRIARLNTRRQR